MDMDMDILNMIMHGYVYQLSIKNFADNEWNWEFILRYINDRKDINGFLSTKRRKQTS